MIDIKLFKEKKLFEKLKISLFNMPPESSFYSSLYFIFFCFFTLVSILYFFSEKTISVPNRNEKVSIAYVGNFKHFLPIYSYSSIDNFVSSLIYSGLLKKDLNNNYVNDLAETVTIDDAGSKVNIKLKDNIRFSNNKDITSDDVIFTYELAANILADGVNRVKYEGLSFEKIDDKNFNIIFAKSFSNINEILSLGVISKDDYINENFETLTSSQKSIYSVTSGIYKINSEEKDVEGIKSLHLVTNNNNHSIPYIKYININTYDDTNELFTDISENENIDIVYDSNNISDTQFFNNENLKEFTKVNHITPRITALFLNGNKKDMLAKKKTREAIYYAINKQEIISAIDADNIPAFDLLPSSKLKDGIDLNKELDTLSTTTINLTIIDNEKQNKIAEIIKENLYKIGLEVNIVKENQNDIINNIIKNRDFDMLLYSIEINNPEDLYAFWHSSQRNAPGLNITSYTSTSFDNNLNTIKTASSSEDIKNSLEKLTDEFYDEYPYIPLYTSVDSMHIKNGMNIQIPNQIYNKKELSVDVDKWYRDTENVWRFIQRQDRFITKIYKLIH